MARLPPASRMAGFTLLEIMVALTIFATLAAAVLSASQYVVKQTGAVENRLFAAWLADNHLNELRVQPQLTVGQQQRVISMDRRDWLVQQSIGTTDHPRLLQVDVRISLVGSEHPLHRASAWIPVRHE